MSAEAEADDDSEKWMPEIEEEIQEESKAETETIDAESVEKQKKKVYLKSGYGAFSNKLKYDSEKLAGKSGKLKDLQIGHSKVPSVQLDEEDEVIEIEYESPTEPDEQVLEITSEEIETPEALLDGEQDFQNQLFAKSKFNLKKVSYVPIADIPTEFENKKKKASPYEAKPAVDIEAPEPKDELPLTELEEAEIQPETEDFLAESDLTEESSVDESSALEAAEQALKSEDEEIDEFLLDILTDLEDKTGLAADEETEDEATPTK